MHQYIVVEVQDFNSPRAFGDLRQAIHDAANLMDVSIRDAPITEHNAPVTCRALEEKIDSMERRQRRSN